jgi:ABC-type branched-subunit amino acid transport system substrate-binding protein
LALALVAAACGTRVPEEIAARRARQAGTTPAVAVAETGPTTTVVAVGPTTTAAPGGTTAGPSVSVPSSAGTPTAATTARTGPSDAGVSDTEIKVGMTAPLSGLGGFIGDQMVAAVDSYFQGVNAAGGLSGRRLKLVAYDDRGDQTQALANIRRLYAQDKVLAIIPFMATGAGDYLQQNHIPTVELGTEPSAWSSKYSVVHAVSEHYIAFVQSIPLGLKQAGVFKPGMRVGLLYDPGSNGPYLQYIKDAWELAGAKVVTADPFTLSDTDCSSQALKVQQLDVDFWDFEGVGTFFFCIAAAQRNGWKPKIGWGSYAASLQFLVKQAGPWADGLYAGGLADTIPEGAPRAFGPEHQRYYGALRKYHPAMANPEDASAPVTMAYWMVARLLTEALEAQGRTVTKDGVNDYINGLRNWDPGLAPPIASMAPNCKTGSGQAWLGRWTWNGGNPKLVPITGYIASPYADRYGGPCYLTLLADRVGV